MSHREVEYGGNSNSHLEIPHNLLGGWVDLGKYVTEGVEISCFQRVDP